MDLIDFAFFIISTKSVLLSLCLLMLFSFIVSSMIRKKQVRIVLSIIFTLLISFQVVSLYFVREFIGYRFYIHFNTRDVLGMIDNYILPTVILLIASMVLIIVLSASRNIIQYFSRVVGKFRFNRVKTNAFKLLVLCLCIVGLSYSETGVIRTSSNLITMLNKEDKNFELLLVEAELNDYVKPKDLKGKKGKNIIIISLESLERGYLNGELEHLTPNLNRLKKEWTYLDVEQNAGSSWTSGSLYTVLTGFPAFFGSDGNTIFQSAYHSNITGISHLLKKVDYNMSYIATDANHGGAQELLNTLKFDKIIDKAIIEKEGRIHDKDLFETAKQEIRKNEGSQDPFLMFISTLDTHFPNGYYDERMEEFLPKQESELEFMVSSTDYLLNNFVQFLKEERLLENTTVFIFPDHLKMGNPTIFEGTGDRGLYLLTNGNYDKSQKQEPLYQIDLPKLILKGAEVEHNIKFLSDYIQKDKNEYIKENINLLTSLNVAGVLRFDESSSTVAEPSKRYNEYKKDVNRFIAHAGGSIEGNTYTNSLEALTLSYEKGFRLFELDILETSDGKLVAAHDWKHWSTITNTDYKGAVTREEFMKAKIYGKYSPMDMEIINKWFSEHSDAILVTDKINEPQRFVDAFVDKDRLMMELFSLKAVKEGLQTNMLSAMASQYVIDEQGGSISEIINAGVKHVTMSRRDLESSIEMVNELRKHGIETYVYHINYDDGIDEEFVVKYEMDRCYGIYADEWDFREFDTLPSPAKVNEKE